MSTGALCVGMAIQWVGVLGACKVRHYFITPWKEVVGLALCVVIMVQGAILALLV